MGGDTQEQNYLTRIRTNDALLAQAVSTSGTGTMEDPQTSLRIVKPKVEPGEEGKTKAAAQPPPGAEGEPTKPARFTITDPRINQGKPTPFERIEDAVAIAGADKPLEHIEESVQSQFMGTLRTAQQKDAAQNLVDLVNIPVEHLAGLVAKGDIKQTATPEELGATIISPFKSKLSTVLDEKQMALLSTAVGIVGMAVIDPMNPALSAGQIAKTGERAGKAGAEEAYRMWLDSITKKMEREAKGQEILDILGEEGKSPRNVVAQFWSSTYNELPEEIQKKFHKYIERVTGLKVGDTIAVKQDGERIIGKEWHEVYPADETPGSVEDLEGAERGLIALMESANRQDLKRQAKMSIDEAKKLLGKPPLSEAIKLLKDERGSIPLGGGGGKQPPGGKPPAPAASGEPPTPGFKRSKHAEEEERIWEDVRGTFEGFAESVTKQRRGPVLHDTDLIKLEKDSDLTMNAALSLPPGTALAPEHLLRVRNMLKRQFTAMKKAQKKYSQSDDLDDFKTMLTAMGHTKGLLRVLLGLYAEPARDVRIMAGNLPKGTAVKAEAGEQFLDKPDAFAQFKEREFRIADEWINHLYDFFVKMEQESLKRPRTPGQAQVTGSVMKEMGDAVDMLKTEEELTVFLKPLANPVFWDVWKEQFYNSMLTGLAPIKNLVGTPTILTMELAQRGVMAGIDSVGTGLVRMTVDPDAKRSVYFGEVGQMLDMAANLEAFQAAARVGWESFKQGKPLVDISHAEHAFPEISDTTLWLYTTGPMSWATSWMSNSMRYWVNKGIDMGSTVGGRMLLGGDTFNKFIAHQMQLRALALRQAYQQIEAEGLQGAEAAQRVQEIKRDILTNSERYPELHDKARQFAQYVALQEELGRAGEFMAQTAKGLTIGPREAGFPSGFPVGTFMMPFTTIMFNAAKMAGEYTGPIALLSPAVRAELKAGGDRQMAALAKMAFSSLMLDEFYNLAREGLITGNGPKDPKAKQAWMEATGKIPNAWWDPISKQYRSSTAFEPFSTVTSAVADLVDMMSYTPPDEFGKIQHAFQSLAIAVMNNIGIKQWTQGIVGTLNTAVSGDYASYEEWFNRAVGTMVPYSGAARQITAGVDPTLRAATNLIDSLKRNTPGLSNELPAQKNALGKVIYRRGGWWNAFSHGLDSQDPDIWKALKDHDLVLGMPARALDGVPLDDWQYSEYVDAVTEGLDEDLRNNFVSDSDNMNDGEAKRLVQRIVENHRRSGRAKFLSENELVQQKIEDMHERRLSDEKLKPSPYAPGRVDKDIFIGP